MLTRKNEDPRKYLIPRNDCALFGGREPASGASALKSLLAWLQALDIGTGPEREAGQQHQVDVQIDNMVRCCEPCYKWLVLSIAFFSADMALLGETQVKRDNRRDGCHVERDM
jgi:hypothetical protein